MLPIYFYFAEMVQEMVHTSKKNEFGKHTPVRSNTVCKITIKQLSAVSNLGHSDNNARYSAALLQSSSEWLVKFFDA